MERIKLNHIYKMGAVITYDFSVSEGLKEYFSGKPFVIEYPESIESVPDAVAAVPFVCSILPIIWLTDSELQVKELDKAFYACIPTVRHSYEEMFPESTFAGKVAVERIVPCDKPANGGSAAFFSGGLDSFHTLIRHIDEKPDLISIWGSDIRYDNAEGWTIVNKALLEAADNFSLQSCTIHSAFREFDYEWKLDQRFGRQLHTGWWYGVKHGMAIIGHAAPYVWLHDISKLYIASSNCIEDGKVRCASDPSLDNNIAFCACTVSHDSFECNRQDKTAEIVQYRNDSKLPIHMHVCWQSQTGNNCGHCEKCYRTMVGLWIAGDDPRNYGFEYNDGIFDEIYQSIALCCDHIPRHTWTYMKRALQQHLGQLQDKACREGLQWMLNYDFIHPEKNKCRIRYQRSLRIKNKMKRTFPRIYNWYVKIRG